MVRIAPVKLAFNPRTLWFDAGDLALEAGQDVVVSTARGHEFGRLDKPVFEASAEETKKLKSPLKPVVRIAGPDDAARADELAELSRAALPIFRQLAAETVPTMNPVAVEYLFEGDKAVFYFEAEERVDFRDLVRKLASQFHVRVDMKQIGVRDGARMVGGLGHCGQELCCRRLGGDFNPVSIRMAKEQGLSLNPQKISGVCGRLMCCLRYEYEAYKDFHGRAPKKNAKIETPVGEGKVVDLDVPREIVSIKVGDDKPVKVPLADMDTIEGQMRPSAVGEEAWERANEPIGIRIESALSLFTNELSGEDKLAEPGKVRHVHDDGQKQPKARTRRRSGDGRAQGAAEDAASPQAGQRKQRRRRSTTVKSDGTARTEKQQAMKRESGAAESVEAPQKRSSSSRRRRGRASANKQQVQAVSGEQQKASQVGRKSSGLRAGRQEAEKLGGGAAARGGGRRRRRSHKTGGAGGAGTAE